MNRIKTITALFLLTIFAACGPTIYKAANFDKTKNEIKTLAILPFNVTIDVKKMGKDMTLESIKESEQKTGYDIQGNAYTWFLHRQKKYSTTFQDVDKTNALLNKANIRYEEIALKEKAELCKILGVDGVISGKASLSKPMSDGAAIAVGLLVGAWTSTNKSTVSLTIHDSPGTLLWKYDYQASGSVGSSSENLTEALMKDVSRKFPYKK